MKLKVSFKKLEHKNWGKADPKYKIGVYDLQLPYAVDVDVACCSILCVVAALIV